MNKTIIAGMLMCVATASADPVRLTRTQANVYTSTDRSVVVATEHCTQTARAMTARVVMDHGIRFVVFYDQNGEEEVDCQVQVLITRKSSFQVASR